MWRAKKKRLRYKEATNKYLFHVRKYESDEVDTKTACN